MYSNMIVAGRCQFQTEEGLTALHTYIVHWRKVWVCFLWGVWGRGASSRGYSYYYSKKDLKKKKIIKS